MVLSSRRSTFVAMLLLLNRVPVERTSKIALKSLNSWGCLPLMCSEKHAKSLHHHSDPHGPVGS